MNSFTSYPLFYEKIFNSFNDLGIKSSKKISSSFFGHWDTDLWGKNDFNYNNIQPIAWDIWNSRFQLENELSKEKGPILSVNWKSNNNWSNERRVQELLSVASASILLGEKTVILTPNWREYGDNDEDSLDCPEIWDVMFTLKPLLIEGKVIVLPYSGIGHDAEQYTCMLPYAPNDYLEKSLVTTKLLTLGVDTTLEQCNSDISLFDYKKYAFKKKLSACLLPVVSVDNLERLLEFSHKYPSSLFRFKIAIDNLLNTHQNDSKQVEKELLQAFAELDDRLDMYSREVNKKAIKMIVQSAAFISSTLLPSDISTLVAILTGSTTIFDGIELIGSSKHAIRSTRDHNFWFPWAWNKLYQKNL